MATCRIIGAAIYSKASRESILIEFIVGNYAKTCKEINFNNLNPKKQ